MPAHSQQHAKIRTASHQGCEPARVAEVDHGHESQQRRVARHGVGHHKLLAEVQVQDVLDTLHVLLAQHHQELVAQVVETLGARTPADGRADCDAVANIC